MAKSATATSVTVSNQLQNRSRLINYLTGINGGTTSSSVATVKLDVNKRYHRFNIQYTYSGAASSVTSATGLNSLKMLVNGITVRDITPQEIVNIQNALFGAANSAYTLSTGELDIFLSEPWRKFLHHDELTSWDLAGQNTFEIDIGVAGGTNASALAGAYEFDYNRNMRMINGQNTPFLQPVAQHLYTFQLAGGTFWINTLPISYPIVRMWIRGNIAAQFTNLEVYQDGNKVLEETVGANSQNANMLGHYGITVANATASTGYDAAYVSDPNQKPWYALKCANSFLVKLVSTAASTVTSATVVLETLPGGYQA